MSYANKNNQTEVDDDKCSVNDNDQFNDTTSGTSGQITKLQDQSIEEKETVSDSAHAKDGETEKKLKLSVTEFFLLKGGSMAIYYGWQIICLIIFIFTAYETLQSVLPKAEKYPEPRQFFATDSFVRDYPRGNLGTLQSKVALSDLSFVLFYAPWSADSQHARPILQTVSKAFYRQAHFLAINCWQPDGECRQQYKKVMAWPVLMAYSRNSIAVPYNGQWSESALARFVYLMLRPIHRINTPDELLGIIHNHDAVVTLFINMQTSANFYNIFYQTATKWLEKDPQGDVAFAVVTGASMQTFGVEREPALRLYLWNKTIEYEEDVWKASLIHKWIIESRQQVTHWLSPPGSRSKEFDTFIQKGPVMLLFTPRNMFDFPSDAYAMVRQIAYEYNNCADDGWLKEMGRNYIQKQRKLNIRNFFVQSKECEKVFDWRNAFVNKCQSFEKHSFVGIANSSKANVNHNEEYCEKVSEPYRHGYVKSSYVRGFPTSIFDAENDLRSSDSVFNEWRDIQCKMIRLSKKIRMKIFQEKPNNIGELNFNKITGLACKTNKTLSFLATDSLSYGLVAERLGLSLKGVDRSAPIIIDGQDESSYVLNSPLSTSNLIDFVYNFTTNKLSRHLRHSNDAKHSHFHNPDNMQSDKHFHPSIDQVGPTRKIDLITISTLSSQNFSNFISDPHRTVAVLFTSSQCAFCTVFSSVLLTISRILSEAEYLKIARIDSDRNDLPWQYTMETVPAFIIFNNKSESRKYPSTMQVTVQNVLGFILSNLSRQNQLKAIASIVKYRSKQKQSIDSTIVILRRETEENIVQSLRAWRLNPLQRNYILRRIQALRRLYFALHSEECKRDFNKLDYLIEDVSLAWRHDTTQ